MKYLQSFDNISQKIRKKAWDGQKYQINMPDGSVKEVYADEATMEDAHRELYDENGKIPSKQEVLDRAFEKVKEKYNNMGNKAIYITVYPKDEKVCGNCRNKEGEIIDIDPPLPVGTEFPARTHQKCRCKWKSIIGI